MPSLVFICVLLTSMSLGLTTSQASRRGTKPAAKLFRTVLPSIKAKTNVPILLPSELPSPLREERIHNVGGDGDANKYEISMYYEVPGSGASFVGYLAGERGEPHKLGKKLLLARGITRYFHARSCGGSCAPSQIEWSQNGIAYTIQLTSGWSTVAREEHAMITTANSAIRGGPR